MKKLRKFLATPGVSLCAIALGILLLGTSTIGGARAAIVYDSAYYTAQVTLQHIHVNLVETNEKADGKGGVVTTTNTVTDENAQTGALLNGYFDANNTLRPGQQYAETLQVQNPEAAGNINEYVRVTLRRYWVDENKVAAKPNYERKDLKETDLDPTLIHLMLGNTELGTGDGGNVGNGWIEDKSARTDERIVLYYSQQLAPGETTPALMDTLCIDGKVGLKVEQTVDANNVVTTTYQYDGKQFVLEAKVDAIQNNHAEYAALSAWGRAVTITDGTLSLN